MVGCYRAAIQYSIIPGELGELLEICPQLRETMTKSLLKMEEV
jgi:hypothetical protein